MQGNGLKKGTQEGFLQLPVNDLLTNCVKVKVARFYMNFAFLPCCLLFSGPGQSKFGVGVT